MKEGGCPFRHVLKLVGTPYTGALLIGVFTIAGAVYFFWANNAQITSQIELAHPTKPQTSEEELIKAQFGKAKGEIRIMNKMPPGLDCRLETTLKSDTANRSK